MAPKNTKTNSNSKHDDRELLPYTVEFTIRGVAPLMFHRYDPAEVRRKGDLPRGSAEKKEDNPASMVWRDEETDHLLLPAEYVRRSIVNASKRMTDPSSRRKSAYDLFNATVVALDYMADLGVTTWDSLDARRAVVQMNAITRIRPVLNKGWSATFRFMIMRPDLIPLDQFRRVLDEAGMMVGVGDFRPQYGRFVVDHFEVIPTPQEGA